MPTTGPPSASSAKPAAASRAARGAVECHERADRGDRRGERPLVREAPEDVEVREVEQLADDVAQARRLERAHVDSDREHGNDPGEERRADQRCGRKDFGAAQRRQPRALREREHERAEQREVEELQGRARRDQRERHALARRAAEPRRHEQSCADGEQQEQRARTTARAPACPSAAACRATR